MALLKKSRVSFYGFISFKLLPVWLTKLLAKTGLVNLYTGKFWLAHSFWRGTVSVLTSCAYIQNSIRLL